MTGVARYDGFAEYYDEHLRDFTLRWSDVLRRLLGPGPGRCLDLGCGTGLHLASLLELGWTTTGIDVSADQLRLARAHHEEVELLEADASSLPFSDASFDAVVSIFTHTDMDDYPSAVCEGARVLAPGGRFVHVGLHPCFVGPFARYMGDEAPPMLFPGYRESSWSDNGPGLGPGLRRLVGAHHVPLAQLLQTFADVGFMLTGFEEPGDTEYPRVLAMVGHKR